MNKISFEEYYNQIRNVYNKPQHEIRNSHGVNDAKKYYTKIKPKGKEYNLNRYQYFKIIRSVSNELVEILKNKHEVMLPCGMGKLFFIVTKITPFFDDTDKLIIPRSIDWLATLKLWYEDKEAEQSKLLIRKDEGDTHVRLKYVKNTAFRNSNVFTLQTTRRVANLALQIDKQQIIYIK